jgi:Fic family protein
MKDMMLNAAKCADPNVVTYEDIVKWWQSMNLKTQEDYWTVLNNFNILFACNSSNIENVPVTYHMTRELFEDGQVNNFTGDITHLMELQNQKFATEYILRSLAENRQIDKSLVLKLHKIMLYGCYDDRRWNKGERPGTFKKNDYCVGVSDVGSFPDEVDEEMSVLLESVNTTECDVLTGAAFLHLSLENIHPFADGNGRLGRTLMNYYLMLKGYPPTVIYNEDKEVYYLALEVFDRTGKMDGFIKFIKEQTIKTWESKVRIN